MTAAPRSFAKLHRVDCLHCGNPFDQWGRRGRLRRTCSDECREARNHHIRTTVRRERYAAARDAGATPRVAQWASNGARIFNAALDVLAEQPATDYIVKRRASPKAKRAAMPPLTPSTELQVKPAKPSKAHPWRGRQSGWRAA